MIQPAARCRRFRPRREGTTAASERPRGRSSGGAGRFRAMARGPRGRKITSRRGSKSVKWFRRHGSCLLSRTKTVQSGKAPPHRSAQAQTASLSLHSVDSIQSRLVFGAVHPPVACLGPWLLCAYARRRARQCVCSARLYLTRPPPASHSGFVGRPKIALRSLVAAGACLLLVSVALVHWNDSSALPAGWEALKAHAGRFGATAAGPGSGGQQDILTEAERSEYVVNLRGLLVTMPERWPPGCVEGVDGTGRRVAGLADAEHHPLPGDSMRRARPRSIGFATWPTASRPTRARPQSPG